MFLAGRDDSIDAMASRLGVRRDYLAGLVRLSYLSLLKSFAQSRSANSPSS
jgi:hypothetical protein